MNRARRVVREELPEGWTDALPTLDQKAATRQHSGAVINALAPVVPELLGGSADLAASNNTDVDGGGDFSADDRLGRNLRFGVREHAMASMANGMALFGGVLPYVATFLIFTDYCRPAIRLSALMQQRVIYVMTHDFGAPPDRRGNEAVTDDQQAQVFAFAGDRDAVRRQTVAEALLGLGRMA